MADVFIGIQLQLPYTLLDIVMTQTGNDEETMATLFLPLALASFIFMILSAYVVDKIKHWHAILALSSLASSVAFVFLYFATTYYQVLIPYLIISVGCSMFTNMVTVGIFRAFNVDGPVILSICDVMIFVMCTLTPQIIRWCSVERADGLIDYQNAMYIFSGVGIIITILLLCIPSPQRSGLIDEDDSEQKRDHAPYSFVAIAVAVDYLKAFNRYIYLSFITTFVKHVHGLSTSDGLDLISTLFTGVLVGQCLTTFLIKAFKPHDIALVFSILTLFGAICFVAAIYIEQNVSIILHSVSVFNGFGSAPLYSVTLASLCSIQPLTGRLSAIYHSADIIASFSPSIAGVLITHFGVEIGLNYLHLLVSILMFILFAINKVQYDNFKKDHVEDGEDIKSTNVAETVGISDS
eukprot:378953_1